MGAQGREVERRENERNIYKLRAQIELYASI
jgi:hypothetical protein